VKRTAVLVLLALACGRSQAASPEETVAAFVSAMEQSRSDPGQRRRAYELLSESSRSGLVARAQRASQVSGASSLRGRCSPRGGGGYDSSSIPTRSPARVTALAPW